MSFHPHAAVFLLVFVEHQVKHVLLFPKCAVGFVSANLFKSWTTSAHSEDIIRLPIILNFFDSPVCQRRSDYGHPLYRCFVFWGSFQCSLLCTTYSLFPLVSHCSDVPVGIDRYTDRYREASLITDNTIGWTPSKPDLRQLVFWSLVHF